MIVLGIETSCDETSVAIVKNGCEILSHVTASQIPSHIPFGGVVPEIASRRHLELILPVLKEATAKISLKEVDLIAYTEGPGLIGPLLIGMNSAKGLALALNKPFIGINHLEAHLAVSMMNEEVPLPAIGILISGGHTALIQIDEQSRLRSISQTVDDAIGEAFDKVAKLMNLPYPGGPEIEKLARSGNPNKYEFKTGHVKGNPLAFSFSGLKTAVLYTLQKEAPINEQKMADIAASFQKAAFSAILEKLQLAREKFPCKSLVIGGGVSSSKTFRELLKKSLEIPLFFPKEGLSMDNAAMIAVLGFHQWRQKEMGEAPLPWESEPRPTQPPKFVG